ncbi:MAG: hypothetical protein ACRD9W_13215, partial [Terriglobia bacterium]
NISLSAAQIEAIKSMDEMGNKAGAQKIILDALSKSVGGAAGAADTGLVGAVSKLKTAWENLKTSFEYMPSGMSTVVDLIKGAGDFLAPTPKNGSFLLDSYVKDFNKVKELQAERDRMASSKTPYPEADLTRNAQQLDYYEKQLDAVTASIKKQSDAEEKEEASATASAAAQRKAAAAADARLAFLKELQDAQKQMGDMLKTSNENAMSFGMNLQDPTLGKAIAFAQAHQDIPGMDAFLDKMRQIAHVMDTMRDQDTALKDEQSAWEKNKQAADDYAKSLADQLDAIIPDVTETQRYDDAIAAAYKTGAQGSGDRIKDLASELNMVKAWEKENEDALKQMNAQAEEHRRKWQGTFSSIREGFAGLFKDTLTGAIHSFGDFLNQIAQMLEKMAAELAANEILQLIMSSYAPSTNAAFGSGSIVDQAGNMAAGGSIMFPTMHKGGVVGDIPRFHSGLAPDEFPAILQKGETVIPKG